MISNRNHPQQLSHHQQNSRGGIHRIGAPQHVATAGNAAATATVIGGVMDRRNGSVAFSTSSHLPGANSSIGGSCGGGGGVGATLTSSFGGNAAKPNINSNQNHNLVHNQAGQTPAAIAISIPAPAGASSSAGTSAPVRRHFVQQQSSSLPYHTILSTSPLEPLHIAADTCCWADLLGGESNVLSSGSNQAPSDITSFASDNVSITLLRRASIRTKRNSSQTPKSDNSSQIPKSDNTSQIPKSDNSSSIPKSDNSSQIPKATIRPKF